MADVARKGILLCLELECQKARNVPSTTGDKTTTISAKNVYLFLNVGLTGRISSPGKIIKIQDLSEESYAKYPVPST